MQKLLVLETPQDIKELQSYLADKDYIAYDLETTGLTQRDEVIGLSVCAEETKAYYVILAAWNKEKGVLDYYPENKKASIELIKSITDKNIICHNAIFDCRMTEAFFKIRLIDSLHTDTMVLAHLLDENSSIGLKELSSSYFGQDSTKEQAEMRASVIANGGSLTKAKYEMFKADSQLLAKYGAQDALLTYKLFMELFIKLHEEGLEKFFYEDESMPLLKGPTYELNTTGLQVDIKRLTSLKKQLEAECEEAKAFIYSEIKAKIQDKYPGTNKKNTFNIGSTSQLAWLLFGEYDLEFSTLTKEGKKVAKELVGRVPYTKSDKNRFIIACNEDKGNLYDIKKKIKEPWSYIACDKKTLNKLASKMKWVASLLEYQRKSKLLSTYIEGIEERTHYGIIHPQFKQCGTTSGRYSSTNPNWQNMPRDDKRIKECIIARPGKVFVGADYSQLEPRVFSYLSKDANLLAAFNGTNDFYSVIGMRVYGKTDCVPQKEGPNAFGEKYKKLRDLSKVIALASVYGSTAHLLSSTTGKSIDDTQADMDAYFDEFPDVAKFMRESHLLAMKQGYVENIFGRKRRMPEAKRIPLIYKMDTHKDLPYEARGLLNLATNHRVQSTGASIVNRASIAMLNMFKETDIKEAKLVTQVHDSLIVECLEADAENVAIIMQHCMENTVTLEGISLEAVPKIGLNFAKV